LRYGKGDQGLVLHNQYEWVLGILHLSLLCVGGPGSHAQAARGRPGSSLHVCRP
jgi:hypothetical protein